jgi:hypothetical protein
MDEEHVVPSAAGHVTVDDPGDVARPDPEAVRAGRREVTHRLVEDADLEGVEADGPVTPRGDAVGDDPEDPEHLGELRLGHRPAGPSERPPRAGIQLRSDEGQGTERGGHRQMLP